MNPSGRTVGKGVSNVVAGVLLAVVVAGALTAVVQWGRARVSEMPSKVAEGVTVASYLIESDLIAVNYGYRGYVAKLVNEDGSVCSDPPVLQLPSRGTAVVTTSCDVGWVEVEGNLIRVVRVAG